MDGVGKSNTTTRPTIAIRGIWLRREGQESDPLATAVVVVELADGTAVRAMEETLAGPFSHYVTALGIREAAEGALSSDLTPLLTTVRDGHRAVGP